MESPVPEEELELAYDVAALKTITALVTAQSPAERLKLLRRAPR